MTTCECCGRRLRQGDIIHGIKYGTLTNTGFKAAQDSAVTVLCGSCGEKAYDYVYSSLDNRALAYPVLFKMVTELSSLMKNGYNLIQSIAKLPAKQQIALKILITACKDSR